RVSDWEDASVADPAASLDEAPAQVDVLAALERLIEAAQVLDHGATADDGGTGDVGNSPVRHPRRLTQTQVERGAHRLVTGHEVVGLPQPHDPRCDQRDGGIAEMSEQRLEP